MHWYFTISMSCKYNILQKITGKSEYFGVPHGRRFMNHIDGKKKRKTQPKIQLFGLKYACMQPQIEMGWDYVQHICIMEY